MEILRISLCCSILLGSYLISEVAYAQNNNCSRSNGSACGNNNRINNNNRIIYPRSKTGSWEIGKQYSVGEKVVYNGKTYTCIQAHTAHAYNWTPPEVPALWQLN